MDTVTQTLENRFMKYKTLYLDMALFDPKGFHQIRHHDEPPKNILDQIFELIPSLEKGTLNHHFICECLAKYMQNIFRRPYRHLRVTNSTP